MRTKVTNSIIILTILAISFSSVLTIVSVSVRASTLYVGGPGPGNFTTIQDAVDASNPGDTIYVYNGTYFEHVAIAKPLNLTGEDKRTTTIDGSGTLDVVNVTSDWVNITGFTITNSGSNFGDAGIELYSVQNCRIAGNDILMDDSGIHLILSDNNTISRNIATDNWAGIFLRSSSNNTISNNTSDNVYGVLLYWSSNANTVADNMVSNNLGGIALHLSDSNSIANNKLSRNGIEIASSRNNVIDNNSVSEIWLAIRLWSSSNNTLTYNDVSNAGGEVWFEISDNNRFIKNNVSSNVGRGVYIYRSNNNTIADNDASFATWDGIYMKESSNNTILNNEMVRSGIYLTGSELEHWNTHTIDTSNTVNGNPVHYWKNANGGTVPSGAGQVILANSTGVVLKNQDISNGSAGIQLGFSWNNTIVNNTFSSNIHEGVFSIYSRNNTVIGNNFYLNNRSIQLLYSTGNIIANNSVSHSFYGIPLEGSNGNTVTNNTVSSNGRSGIFLLSSDNNTISTNTASSNERGIEVLLSNGNIIDNNTASSNGKYGIVLKSSSDNRIYHNNFISNLIQAYDDNGTNQWDDGYPSGGNFWSTYTGNDYFKGPAQDEPGSDGIGDVSFPTIGPGSNEDSYPLMFPAGTLAPPMNLTARLSGQGFHNITLQWELSLNDGGGVNRVTKYEVFRGTGFYDQTGSGYQLVTTISNGTSAYVDAGKGEGDPDNHFYVVCAVGSWKNAVCNSKQAAKFTRPLSEGVNLISIPLIQSNESMGAVLQTASYDKAWFFNSVSKDWKSYDKLKPYLGNLFHLNHTIGIWLNVTQDSNLTIVGTVPLETVIHLRPGWNLVGYPSFSTSYTVGDLKAETGSTRVEGFDPSIPPYFLIAPADGNALQTGFGYWVRVENYIDWVTRAS